MSDLLASALGYLLEREWSILPIAADKKPPKGFLWKPFQASRPSEATIRKCFALPNITGVAVIFGAVSGGLASRDFDNEGGYEQWAQDHSKLAISLPTARTKRGYHVYFRAQRESYADLGDGEYRADSRHYSVLPPSRHPSGFKYAWKFPLPMKGKLPLIDPAEVGLVHYSQNATERTERTERTEQIASVCSVSSVLSVTWTEDLERTLPHSEGQRNRSTFALARLLKGIPQFADAAAEQMEPIVREWHRRAFPIMGTKPFDETRIDFLVSWGRVKFPAGTGPLEQIMRKATTSRLPAAAKRYDSDGVRKLVGLCAALQDAAGDAAFFLSCRTAAKVLGIPHHETAWRWIMLLKHDGLLVETEKATPIRAARYRYIGGPK